MTSATTIPTAATPERETSSFPPLLLALFFLSGATGLVYELVWTRELTLVFGGTTYAITTTLVAFMGGLGLGSYVAGRVSQRIRQPGVAYGLMEIGIGLFAVATPYLLELAQPIYRALYPSVDQYPLLLTGARFLISGAILFLPTFMMGATMPLLARFVTLKGGELGMSTGVLYGVNSGGAVLGVLITGFFLIPTLGVKTATYATAIANVTIGALAVMLLRVQTSTALPRIDDEAPREEAVDDDRTVRQAVLLSYGLSGFAAMIYQIMWTRALVLSLGSSTYSFTCILSAFILGLSLGSLAMARFADRFKNPGAAIGFLQLCIGLSAVVMLPIHGYAPVLMFQVTHDLADHPDQLLWARFIFVIAITLIPTLLMGAQFPLIARILARSSNDAAGATGRAYAANTLGAITGSFLGGFVLIVAVGTQHSITLAAVMNALAGVWLMRVTREPGPEFERRSNIAALAALAVPVVALLFGKWDSGLMSGGGFHHDDDPRQRRDRYDLLYYAEGVDITVSVSQAKDDRQFLTLTVNSKPDASTARVDMVTQLLTGHLPALLAPDRDCKALVIGLGSGITVSSLAQHEHVKSVECAEISEEVVNGARLFKDYNHAILEDNPRVTVKHADGRNHLLLTDQTYDLIVSEPSNPWISGVANLFTREFFTLAKDHLSEDGIFLGWIHGYSNSVDNFKLVLRTISSVFEHISVWELSENDYGILCSRKPLRVPFARVSERFGKIPVREDLYRIGICDIERVFARYIGNDESLASWIGEGPIHRDATMQLEFTAPRYLYLNVGSAIVDGLMGSRRSPIGDVVELSPDDPRDADMIRRIDQVRTARYLRIAGYDFEYARRDPIGMMRTLLHCYRLLPGDADIFRLITDSKEGVTLYAPDVLQTEEGAKLMQELTDLREPMWAPRNGAPLGEIAIHLRQLAGSAVRVQHWHAAFDYLKEAYDLEPQNGALIIEMAWVLTNAGAKDEAFRGLEIGVKSGALTVEDLSTAEPLNILRDDPRFAALLTTASSQSAATQSAPTSAPVSP